MKKWKKKKKKFFYELRILHSEKCSGEVSASTSLQRRSRIFDGGWRRASFARRLKRAIINPGLAFRYLTPPPLPLRSTFNRAALYLIFLWSVSRSACTSARWTHASKQSRNLFLSSLFFLFFLWFLLFHLDEDSRATSLVQGKRLRFVFVLELAIVWCALAHILDFSCFRFSIRWVKLTRAIMYFFGHCYLSIIHVESAFCVFLLIACLVCVVWLG